MLLSSEIVLALHSMSILSFVFVNEYRFTSLLGDDATFPLQTISEWIKVKPSIVHPSLFSHLFVCHVNARSTTDGRWHAR